MPAGCTALLSASVSYLEGRLRDEANSGLWVLMYTGWVPSCAHHRRWDAYEYHRLWYFPPVLSAVIKALDLFTFLGGQFNADELQCMISVIESVDWKMVPGANNLKPKVWRCLSSHSHGRLEVAGDFVKYDAQPRRVFVTQID